MNMYMYIFICKDSILVALLLTGSLTEQEEVKFNKYLMPDDKELRSKKRKFCYTDALEQCIE